MNLQCILASGLFGISSVMVSSSDGAIITSTGPSYTYEWSAQTATGLDANAAFAGDTRTLHTDAATKGVRLTQSGTRSFTTTYEFDTPSGYEFDSASVFTRVAWYQDTTHSIKGEYSLNGGTSWTEMFNFTARTTTGFTSPLTGIDGVENVLIRYTYSATNTGSNPQPDHGRLFVQSTTATPGFSFTAAVVVPEPASLAAAGFAGLLGLRRRRLA